MITDTRTTQGCTSVEDMGIPRSDLSLCKNCYCMTKTVRGKCGKCKDMKIDKHLAALLREFKEQFDTDICKYERTDPIFQFITHAILSERERLEEEIHKLMEHTPDEIKRTEYDGHYVFIDKHRVIKIIKGEA